MSHQGLEGVLAVLERLVAVLEVGPQGLHALHPSAPAPPSRRPPAVWPAQRSSAIPVSYSRMDFMLDPLLGPPNCAQNQDLLALRSCHSQPHGSRQEIAFVASRMNVGVMPSEKCQTWKVVTCLGHIPLPLHLLGPLEQLGFALLLRHELVSEACGLCLTVGREAAGLACSWVISVFSAASRCCPLQKKQPLRQPKVCLVSSQKTLIRGG